MNRPLEFLRIAGRTFAIVVAVGLPFAIAYRAALAQDRTVSVREVDVQPLNALITVQPDGGCLFVGTANVVSPSLEVPHARSQYVFNGARCTTVKNAIIAAAKKDLGCGDGSDP